MAAVGNVLKAVTPIGMIASALFGGKKAAPAPTAVSTAPVATPRSNSVALDALSRRQGSAANQRTGSGGAESRTTAKKQLLGQ